MAGFRCIFAAFATLTLACVPLSEVDNNGGNNNYNGDDAGRVFIVSVTTDGTPAFGQISDVAGRARRVVFSSSSSSLVPNDTNNSDDVFMRDFSVATTARISVNADGVEANGISGDAHISSDGRYVVYHSFATNLTADDHNGVGDIFLFETASGRVTRVSSHEQFGADSFGSERPSISNDGRWVVYHTYDDLIPDVLASSFVVRYDTQSGERLPVGPGERASISDDGRYVAMLNYVSVMSDLILDIFVVDLETGERTQPCLTMDGSPTTRDVWDAEISGDGRYIVFASPDSKYIADDTNNEVDVFVCEIATGQVERVSVNSEGVQGDGRSYQPSISADGAIVAFSSAASNFSEIPATNRFYNVYVHDRASGVTEFVSRPDDGLVAEFPNGELPSISTDGRYVSFESNLLVYVRDRNPQ